MDLDDVIPSPQYQICHSRVARAPLPAVWDALHRVTMSALPLGHNTKDFRFLWRSEVLLASGSVSALESVFMMAVLGWGHAICPRVAAGLACGSTVRGPAGRFLLPGGFGFLAAARGSRARKR